MAKSLALYIHIPFCPYRCHYCDFVILTGHQEAIPSYVEALIGDLGRLSKEHPGRKIHSIYFGGGTPSLLDSHYYEELLSAASKHFAIARNPEISLEANPETLSPEKLSGYLSAGINRLSLGVQALQENHLRRMGRFPGAAQCREAFRLARNAGFKNLNVDLLFALPEQTLEEWKNTLAEILSWGPEHLSAYGLQVEPGTRFRREEKRGNLPLPSEEAQVKMYETLLSSCRVNGFSQYEISNFAKPGFECRHNLTYWRNEEYLGIGLGAVSYIKGKRFWMTRNFKKYLSGEEREVGSETLPRSRRMGETLMLGLRLRNGISTKRFSREFGQSPESAYGNALAKFRGLGFVAMQGDRLALTERGLFVSNEVLQAFV